MKTTYTPQEWLQSLKEQDKHWFIDPNNQEKLLYEFAKELYLITEYNDFTEALKEARSCLTEFYNFRYNPNTREKLNG